MSNALSIWQAGASLSTQRDLEEEIGIAIGHTRRYAGLAHEVGRSSDFRRVYVQCAADLRERRDWLRNAIRNFKE